MNEFLKSWTDKRNRIIVFAGVFDPVHKGHVSAAEEAMRHGSRVVFLPERVPQHKHGATDYVHRLNMLRIVTEHNEYFEVLDYPYDNQWVEQTFNWLSKRYPDRKFIWLVGNDVIPHVESWEGSDKLADLNVDSMAVIKRDGLDDVRINTVHTTPVIHLHRTRQKHELLSSSTIREDLRSRHTSLPTGVWQYIQEHNLYNN